MKRFLILVAVVLSFTANAQVGKTFWFAAPAVTKGHDGGRLAQEFRVSTFDSVATVRIYQPANTTTGLDTTIVVPASSSSAVVTTAYQDFIETLPYDQVVSTGVLVESDVDVTVYYEVATPNNTDIFALKSTNALGTEFYVPFQTLGNNGNYSPTPYSQFNIVATENNTTIWVFPKVDIFNHVGNAPYKITLNRGESYSGRAVDRTAANHPVGVVISSDKPIAVTYADDSVEANSCRDLLGDQLVPTSVIGKEYIVNSNSANLAAGVSEQVIIIATQNFTTIEKDGTPDTVLFAGQSYTDVITASSYYKADKPIYLIQVTGFGCELGSAILPPLNCAGSDQVSFGRNGNGGLSFFLSILVRSGSEDAFTLDGDATLIQASDFAAVPGTGGDWVTMFKEFNTTEVSPGNAHRVVNTKDVFSLGIVNGNTNGGTRYGYFSLFQSEIIVDGGVDQFVCSGNDVTLAGSVRGGAVTGLWSVTNGTGNFTDATDLNTVYDPSASDYATGNLTFVIESTGLCTAEYDTMLVNFTPGPTIDAGVDQTVCYNNADVDLTAVYNGIVSSVLWSTTPTNVGGFSPGNTSNPTTYTPTTNQKDAGSFKMYVTSVGVGSCQPVTDSLEVTVVAAPIVEAGSPLTSCENNPDVTLGGSVTTYSGLGQGVWSGGGNSASPSNNALTGTYSPTPTEITNGVVVLNLESTNNGLCNAENDNVTITYTTAPTVNAGNDQTLCANNSAITLNGSFTAPATQAVWIGGTTSGFSTNRNDMNAVYTPTLGEIALGTLTLTLQSSAGNGTCLAATDDVTFTFTTSPTIDAGPAQTVCANNDLATFTSVFTTAAGVQWSGGAGSYVSGSTSNPLSYRPSNAEKTAGSVMMYAATTGMGNCNAVVDSVLLTIQASPIVEAGLAQSLCKNNPDATLGGSVITYSGAGQGEWSGGTNVVSPSANALTGVYTPTATELTNGLVTLTLSSINNNNCVAESDNVTITYTTAPTISAGNDQTVCANNAEVTLAGSFTAPATQGTWIGGAGLFTPNRTTPNAVYTPTPGEIALGSLILTFETSAGLGNCNTVSDQMTITFTPSPTIDAGAAQTVCANNDLATFTSVFTTAAGVQWSGGLGTYVSGSTSNPLSYRPSNAEKTAGSVMMYATTTGMGNCNAVVDSVLLTIQASPIVEAGVAQSLCKNNPDATLGGSVITYSGAGQGEWTGGTNVVNPSANALTGVYTPTATELTNGLVTLTLTSTNNNNCISESDNVTLTYTTAPTISAGSDQTLCANNADVTLAGSFTAPATQGTWIGGAGLFSPDRTTANAVYTPTPGEIALGSLILTFETSAGLGNCNSVSDQVTLTFTQSPSIEAGAAKTVCANNSESELTAVFTTAAGVQWSGGLGSYVTGSTSNPLTYNPSNAEKTAGSVMLYATTTGVGNCTAVTDSVLITIEDAPIVEAGSALNTCANNPDATLSGSVTTYSGFGQGIWSGGSGSVSPANDALAGSYGPTNAEITNGTVVLTLTSTNNGLCNEESDNVTLIIDPAPVVNAGTDQSVCSNNNAVNLAGSATGGNGQWIGGNGTFNPNRTTLNAIYTPTEAELSFGSVTLTLQTTNNGLCNAVSDDIIITFSPSPTVEAGANKIVCANNSDVSLTATRSVATGVQWSGGAGTYLPNAFSDNITYQPTNTEISAGQFMLYATTTGIGNCVVVVDSVEISVAASPIVDAGSSIESCENNPGAQLVGSVTPYTGLGQGTWSGGFGFVTPSNDALTGVYTPTAPEIANGAVSLTLTSTNNGICNDVSDNVLLTIVPAPEVNAGNDVFVCGNNSVVNLAGSVSNAGGARWLGGLGTFNPDRNTLNAVYTPTQDEINLGSINLTLESTSNGSCTAVQDQMSITFTTSPTVEAGLNQTVCANNVDVPLSGSFSIATGAQWNGFDGTIVSGTASDMNAVYRPSAAEVTAGSAIVYLTSTGNGSCAAVTDSMIITITIAPTVNAGTDITVCANNSSSQLDGTFTTAGGVQWSGGNGSFTPSSQVRDAEYFPTVAEIASGFVNLTLQTTANGLCNAVSDNVLINITPSPTVNAGVDQSICDNNPFANLSATVTKSTGVTWSGGNGNYSPDRNQLSFTYEATPTEVNNGNVELIVTTTGNGICNAVSDTMNIAFTSAPLVEAGDPATLCANKANTFLNGQVLGASGGIWKSNGGGSFNPDNVTLNATYSPSSDEIIAGKAVVYLESTGNGNCIAVEDSVIFTISPSPSVNAGTAQTTCANNSTVQLAGSFTNSAGVTWGGGTGSYNPAITDVNAQYNPSSAEIAAGSVTLTLTSTGNSTCFEVNDDVVITISGAPTVTAGADQTKCANNSLVQLVGDYSLATGGVWSGGLGTFTPNATSKSASYKPTQTEINSGSLTLSYSTTGNGSCNSVSDDVNISFTQTPTVEAGLTKVTCANNPAVDLDGGFSIATGIQWYGYSGTFSTSETDPVATYTASATEISNGFVSLKIRTTGNGTCLEVTDSVVVNISPAPFVDAGNDVFNCIDDLDVSISGIVTGGASTGRWSTTGTGFFTPNANSLNAVYKMSSQDSLAGTVTLTLTSTNNGDCIPVNDELEVFLTTPGIANAGADRSVCANNSAVALNGQVTGGALGGVWSTSGSGQFIPDANTLNATYIPSNVDTANGSVTLTLVANSCDQNIDEFLLTITDAPIVDAGIDQVVCSDEEIVLAGKVSGASVSGIWSSSGNGTFNPDQSTLNTTYNTSGSDRSNGRVSLFLISTNVGNCSPEIDTLDVVISPAGIVNAGSDVTICANNSELQLSGSVSGGANVGRWTTSGTGAFVPNDTTLAAVYQPSNADKTNGSVDLVLTGNSCDNAADTIAVTITESPSVNAGADEIVCENNSDVNLNGSVTVAGGGIWSSTGTGTFVPNVFALNAVYEPSETDQNVTVYLKSFGNGSCLEVADSMTITVTPKPNVSAGIDQTICNGVTRVNIKGTITGGASTGVWSSLGTGGFDPGAVLLETDYLMSSSDSANRGATLILTSTSNGDCNAESDTLLISITDVGASNAGGDISVCANDLEIQLNGSIQGGATQGYWITSGTGTFAPDSTDLNAVYSPSTQDSLNGTVTVSLVSNSCDGAQDDKVITITPAPFVEAGPSQVTCVDDLNIALDGIVAGASTSGRWTSSGTGTFVPNNQTLNATYRASSNDSISGNVLLTLTPTNIGNCTAKSDNLDLRITTGGTVSAGPDVIICSNSDDVQLAGSFGGGATVATWSSTGTGVFIPNASDVAAVYSPSTQDKQNGIVTLTLTANSCDKVEDEMTISITQAPTVDAGNNLILCENKTDANLFGSVSGASGAIWTTTGSGSFTPSNSSLSATYKPSKTDIDSKKVLLYLTTVGNGNCKFERDSITLTFTPGPKPNAGEDLTVCKTSSSVVIKGTVSGPTTTGEWSTIQGGGFFTSDPNDLTAEYVFGPVDTARGFVRLLLTTTNSTECNEEMDTVTVTLGGTTFASAGNDVYVCNENLLGQLNGNVGGGATMGTWSTNGDGIFSPSENTLNATYRFGSSDSINRSVQLVLSANSSGGCIAGTDTVRIIVSEVPSVDAGSDIVICQGKDTVIYAGTGVNTVAHKWVTTGSGTFEQGKDTSLAGGYIFGAGDKFAGSVQLILTGESIAGCKAIQDTTNITIGDPLEMDFFLRNLCVGDETEFDDSTKIEYGTITSWLWRFGDGTESDVQHPRHVYDVANIYEVALQVVTNQGCVDSLKRTVTVRPSPVANFELDVPNEEEMKVGDVITFVDQSVGALAWSWIFGTNLDSSFNQFPEYIYEEEGEFDVTLSVLSQFGCSDTLIKAITILTDVVLPPNVPNAFTPNGDEQNDKYFVRGGPFETLEFKIYNEWGNLVFETSDPEIGWDGKKNGDYQAEGVYSYTLKATLLDGRVYKKSGDVTLIR